MEGEGEKGEKGEKGGKGEGGEGGVSRQEGGSYNGSNCSQSHRYTMWYT